MKDREPKVGIVGRVCLIVGLATSATSCATNQDIPFNVEVSACFDGIPSDAREAPVNPPGPNGKCGDPDDTPQHFTPFIVYDPYGNPVGQGWTDENGKYTFNLPPSTKMPLSVITSEVIGKDFIDENGNLKMITACPKITVNQSNHNITIDIAYNPSHLCPQGGKDF